MAKITKAPNGKVIQVGNKVIIGEAIPQGYTLTAHISGNCPGSFKMNGTKLSNGTKTFTGTSFVLAGEGVEWAFLSNLVNCTASATKMQAFEDPIIITPRGNCEVDIYTEYD